MWYEFVILFDEDSLIIAYQEMGSVIKMFWLILPQSSHFVKKILLLELQYKYTLKSLTETRVQYTQIE